MIKVNKGEVELDGTNADVLTEASLAVATAVYFMADDGKNELFASASLYAITLAAANALKEKDVNVDINFISKQIAARTELT